MNQRIARSKSTLFLIELILAIGIFAVASAVCIQLFAEAHLISYQNEAKTHALYAATSAAEVFKATGGQSDRMAELLSAREENGTLTVHYNADWTAVPEPAEKGYTMHIRLDFNTQPASADIRVSDSAGNEVYALLTRKYTAHFPTGEVSV